MVGLLDSYLELPLAPASIAGAAAPGGVPSCPSGRLPGTIDVIGRATRAAVHEVRSARQLLPVWRGEVSAQ